MERSSSARRASFGGSESAEARSAKAQSGREIYAAFSRFSSVSKSKRNCAASAFDNRFIRGPTDHPPWHFVTE